MDASDREQIRERIRKQQDFIEEHGKRVATNLRRADRLIEIAEKRFPSRNRDDIQAKDDMLRAAVVLLHATLEDYLRYIGFKYIPSGGEEVLNKISLIGGPDRPEKFFLGKLAKHRGKTVDQLITESVEAHLDKRSFSNTADISQLLESARVPSAKVEAFFPSLQELMDTRHEIVHKGDLTATIDQEGERVPKAIDASKVTEWSNTIQRFTSTVAAYKMEMGDLG